ncbi:maleylacetoacetate isomerase [Sphingobium cloacae]|uniref:Maleylacetoacetate isomerase n=1 Tax=Sphingobium cloacae TaxID=120107 RepID=A0A1E1F2M8_9SPHN|nr:maleylacetoacetate isomerase [Sphingobium cloacae]BAV64701.1 maleylacetoacetate isomerase [Sphingobium cloacae]
MAGLVLHGYWRSGTSYRTRIALNVKGLDYRQTPVDLLNGEQRSAAYRALNPQALVPALEADGRIFTQSSAIIEWLEERYPAPPLLPANADDRAIVRAMAMIVACDIHPLNNARVLNALTGDLGADDTARQAWVGRWIASGFAALEEMILRHGGLYAFGDDLTMADCHLVPQAYAAERFAVPLDGYPALMTAVRHALDHPAVKAAHPDLSPGHP